MLFKKQIISAMAGVAMLALPVSALAYNGHDYNRTHPEAAHHARVDHHRAAVEAHRYANTYNHGQWTPPASWTSTPNQSLQPNPGNSGYVPRANWHHHWNPYAWNNGYAPPAYQPSVAPSYAAPVYTAPVYPYPAPSYSGSGLPNYNGYGLGSGYGNQNNLSWLMQKRRNTMENIAQMRARGDSKGAARLVPEVRALDQRIASMR